MGCPSELFARALACLLAAALAVAALPAQAQQGSPDLEQIADLAVRLTNQFREQEGRKAVAVNAQLFAAARDFALYMARTGRFAHDADDSNPAARAKKQGYEYCIISENIAYRSSSTRSGARELAQGFVDGWKSSPGHRKNMLEPDVTETAIAIVPGPTGYYYAAQLFGRPLSQAVKFSVANRTNGAVRYRIDQRRFSLAPRESRTHQNCRSSAIEFDWEGQEREKVDPKNGGSYTVVRSETGGLTLRSERQPAAE